jgi:hypothetical protein
MTKLFADDTAIINEDDNLERLIQRTNTEFQKICKYFRSNKLSLHPDKTKFVVISNSLNIHVAPVSIFINNNNPGQNNQNLIHEIQRVNLSDTVPAIKYLGVYFDPGLSFKYHIQQMSSKISKALYHLRCVKNILPSSALISLYYALIHSHLTYAVEIWGVAAQNLINELYLKQKAAIRIICNSKFNAHTAPLFKELGILPVPLLITNSFINIMHHHHNKKLPEGLSNIWTTIRSRLDSAGAPSLRYEENYNVPFMRTNQLLRFPLICVPQLWNELSHDIKSITSFNSFSSNVKKHLLQNLSTTCNRLC